MSANWIDVPSATVDDVQFNESRQRCEHRFRWFARAVAPIIVVTAVAGCSSDDAGTTSTKPDVTVVPDQTAIAPGSCDPSEAVNAPSIKTAGTTTDATLGFADLGCAGINGDGYISFNYNPVLIDGDGSVTVTVDDGVTASLSWTGLTAFAESTPGTWTSTLDPASCNRLTIQLRSTSGESTATYGADIRVGGETSPCPQRTIDPSDVPDDNVGGTLAPPASGSPATTAAPTTTAA